MGSWQSLRRRVGSQLLPSAPKVGSPLGVWKCLKTILTCYVHASHDELAHTHGLTAWTRFCVDALSRPEASSFASAELANGRCLRRPYSAMGSGTDLPGPMRGGPRRRIRAGPRGSGAGGYSSDLGHGGIHSSHRFGGARRPGVLRSAHAGGTPSEALWSPHFKHGSTTPRIFGPDQVPVRLVLVGHPEIEYGLFVER